MPRLRRRPRTPPSERNRSLKLLLDENLIDPSGSRTRVPDVRGRGDDVRQRPNRGKRYPFSPLGFHGPPVIPVVSNAVAVNVAVAGPWFRWNSFTGSMPRARAPYPREVAWGHFLSLAWVRPSIYEAVKNENHPAQRRRKQQFGINYRGCQMLRKHEQSAKPRQKCELAHFWSDCPMQRTSA